MHLVKIHNFKEKHGTEEFANLKKINLTFKLDFFINKRCNENYKF